MAVNPSTDEPVLATPRTQPFWRSPFGRTFAAASSVAILGVVLILSGHVPQPAKQVDIIKGIMASKQDFFNDAEVQQMLLKHNLVVNVTTRGSSEVAAAVIDQESDEYDFAFPSGQPAADLIKADRRTRGRYQKTTKLFSSPMVLATYREYAETLVQAKAATPHSSKSGHPFYYILETAKFLELGESGQTWNDIDLSEHSEINGGRKLTNSNRVLAYTSGVCRSNSGATYLGLLAFVKNGNRAPRSEAEVDKIGGQLQEIIAATGMPVADLVPSYIRPEGKSQAPIIVIYEHQYLDYQLDQIRKTGSPDTTRTLLYPREEFQTDAELISFNEKGQRLASLLANDPSLRRRMMELGYRMFDDTDTVGTSQLFQHLIDRGLPRPAERNDATRADLPTLGLLERLIDTAGGCP